MGQRTMGGGPVGASPMKPKMSDEEMQKMMMEYMNSMGRR
jgi:hypothetical protein